MSEEKKGVMQKFKDFYDLIKGRKDVRSRVAVLLNPENLKTSSILSKMEAEFVTEAFWLAEHEACYKPLEAYAKHKLETNISIGGKGVENAIRLMASLSEAKLLSKLGITSTGEVSEGKAKK